MKHSITLVIVSLLLLNQAAVAAGPNPPAKLSPSTTPTATYQVFMPVMSSRGEGQQASVPAGTAISKWGLGVAALVVLSALYLALRVNARRKKR